MSRASQGSWTERFGCESSGALQESIFNSFFSRQSRVWRLDGIDLQTAKACVTQCPGVQRAREPPLLLRKRSLALAHPRVNAPATTTAATPSRPPPPRRAQKTSDESREAHRQALLQQAGANAGAVPEAAIRAALDMQMVESIPLLHNTRQDGFIAVNM